MQMKSKAPTESRTHELDQGSLTTVAGGSLVGDVAYAIGYAVGAAVRYGLDHPVHQDAGKV
jgi:hypothetical protein